jgi:hypothetical protein
MLEEEEEPPVGVEKEEEPSPTSPLSRLSQRREEERCGGGWAFPLPAYTREEKRCDNGWSFSPRGARKEERRGSTEKQISRSRLGPASSRVPSAC